MVSSPVQSTARSPFWIVILGGAGMLALLLIRGLDIGPLHTDVLIHRAWFSEVGVGGFTERYLDWNQRHLLVGPINQIAYLAFQENDLPYNVIFQASRVFEGAFLAGIVFQVVGWRKLAIAAGLALMLTPIRLAELYQGINWYIEPTLALLLGSSYFYVLSLKGRSSPSPLGYGVSIALYSVSVLTYESGLPWIAVNMCLGWFLYAGQPLPSRAWQVVRDALPIIAIGVAVAVIVLVVFEPWVGLAPNSESTSITRLLEQIGTLLTFPAVYWRVFRTTFRDGYAAWFLLSAAAAGLGLFALLWREHVLSTSRNDYLRLAALSVVMVFAGVLVGSVNQETGTVLVDRLTFGRAPGIMLFQVTIVFLISDFVLRRWLSPTMIHALAAALVGIVLLGPGLIMLLAYQDYAQRSRGEIERLTAAILQARPAMTRPVHLVILTPTDWPLSHFPDSSDVIVHEVQQNLYERGGDATIDILTRGVYEEDYAVHPNSCDTLSGQASAGICLAQDRVYSSRWAIPHGATHPNENVVIARYDEQSANLEFLAQIDINDLNGYNIATAGPSTLATNPDRLLVPIE